MVLDGFGFFGGFLTNFSKSMKIKDMKLNVLMLIINMGILNGLDYELGADKSADNYIHRLEIF